MIPFIKKYKFFIITAAAVVAALVIAFIAGNGTGSNNQTPDESSTTLLTLETTVADTSASATTAASSSQSATETTASETIATTVQITQNKTTVAVAAEEAEPTEPATDKYKTDPVPTDNPQPVEPQDQTTQDNMLKCTLSISCATILDNMDKLDEEYHELVPSDGWILKQEEFEFTEGESVFDLLVRVCKDKKIHLDHSFTPAYNSAYIKAIGNLYEFDCGDQSGWVYGVNGWAPNYGCSRYVLKNGDTVEFRYTCQLGHDLKWSQ